MAQFIESTPVNFTSFPDDFEQQYKQPDTIIKAGCLLKQSRKFGTLWFKRHFTVAKDAIWYRHDANEAMIRWCVGIQEVSKARKRGENGFEIVFYDADVSPLNICAKSSQERDMWVGAITKAVGQNFAKNGPALGVTAEYQPIFTAVSKQASQDSIYYKSRESLNSPFGGNTDSILDAYQPESRSSLYSMYDGAATSQSNNTSKLNPIQTLQRKAKYGSQESFDQHPYGHVKGFLMNSTDYQLHSSLSREAQRESRLTKMKSLISTASTYGINCQSIQILRKTFINRPKSVYKIDVNIESSGLDELYQSIQNMHITSPKEDADEVYINLYTLLRVLIVSILSDDPQRLDWLTSSISAVLENGNSIREFLLQHNIENPTSSVTSSMIKEFTVELETLSYYALNYIRAAKAADATLSNQRASKGVRLIQPNDPTAMKMSKSLIQFDRMLNHVFQVIDQVW